MTLVMVAADFQKGRLHGSAGRCILFSGLLPLIVSAMMVVRAVSDWSRRVLGILLVFAMLGSAVLVRAEGPTCLDERLQIELFAAEPEIVTPTALTVDELGNPLVIECHTHFRPDEYDGPPADRIRRFEDANGDGKADRITTFWEGSTATMGIGRHPTNGWTYVATRDDVFRLRDADGDGAAELREMLVTLESEDKYPHAGISGFAFDAVGDVYFGLGENHAKPFVMTGKDGKQLSGIEGGHVYRMHGDGSGLSRVSIGCWNPFHLTFDFAGRLFVVDNDPDSLPPCRLLHIVQGGDYGYKYRNGRKGTHPYTAWNGELPGTLPMVAGTGEAPSGILACGRGDKLPADFAEDLLVTSWGDHRIERYALSPRGASVTAERIDVVRGGEDFRPVGIAVGGEGAVYITDWVDKSYELHKKGRIWRLSSRSASAANQTTAGAKRASLSEQEKTAAHLRDMQDTTEVAKLWEQACSDDPFLAQAAREGLGNVLASASEVAEFASHAKDARQRLAALLILRSRMAGEGEKWLPMFLNDADPDVRFAALQWTGEERLKQHRSAVENAISAGLITQRLFAAWVATKEKLDQPPRRDSDELPGEAYLASALVDASTPENAKVWALRGLRSNHPTLTKERFVQWMNGSNLAMQLEAVRSLGASSLPEKAELLAAIAQDNSAATELRAAAIAGFSGSSDAKQLLLDLTSSSNEIVQEEALRALKGTILSEEERERIGKITGNERIASLVAFLLRPEGTEDAATVEQWLKEDRQPGDPTRGERIFFHVQSGTCFRCHQMGGRGATIGPDLTTTARRLERTRLIESLFQPSKEIAPQFVSWALQTTDGRSLVGMLVAEKVDGSQQFADSEGRIFTLRPDEVEARKQLSTSLMPTGLYKQMTREELRDLLAFLQQQDA